MDKESILDKYITFFYNGVEITLKKEEKEVFEKMPRKEKRKMAQRFENAVKKGRIRLIEVKGKKIAIRNDKHRIHKRTDQKNSAIRKLRANKIRQKT